MVDGLDINNACLILQGILDVSSIKTASSVAVRYVHRLQVVTCCQYDSVNAP